MSRSVPLLPDTKTGKKKSKSKVIKLTKKDIGREIEFAWDTCRATISGIIIDVERGFPQVTALDAAGPVWLDNKKMIVAVGKKVKINISSGRENTFCLAPSLK